MSQYVFGLGQISLSNPLTHSQISLPKRETATQSTTGTIQHVAITPREAAKSLMQVSPTNTTVNNDALVNFLTGGGLKTQDPRRAPTSTSTQRTQPADLQISPKVIAAIKDPQGGPRVPSGGGSGGSAPGGQTAVGDAFATACRQEGGSPVSAKVCRLPDGAEVTVDANGNPACVNAVGRCAGNGGGGGKLSTPLMIGGAALLALTLLK